MSDTGEQREKDRWVNAVITFTIPLEVPIDASVGEKADAAQAIAERHFPEMPGNAVGTIGFRDVENGEPLLPAELSKLGELERIEGEREGLGIALVMAQDAVGPLLDALSYISGEDVAGMDAHLEPREVARAALTAFGDQQ